MFEAKTKAADLRLCFRITQTSSQKDNDRSPESKQVFLNACGSQVSKIFFSIGQGQLTPQSMVRSGPISNSFETV